MNPGKKCCRQRGFTILELVTVVVVIALLALIAVPRFLTMRDRGHIGAAQANLAALRHALAAYAADHDAYPPSVASYQKLQALLVDYEGHAYVSFPSRETFQWVSYQNDQGNPHSNTRSLGYSLVVQALDSKGTTLTATPDGITVR